MCVCNKQPIIVKQKDICAILTNNNNEVDSQISWDIEPRDKDVVIHIPKLSNPVVFNDEFVFGKENKERTKELSQK